MSRKENQDVSDEKIDEKTGMVSRMSDTAFRVHCIYPRKETASKMTKKWKKINN
jgi:hypothetical protein